MAVMINLRQASGYFLIPVILAVALGGCKQNAENGHMTVGEQVRAEIGGKLFVKKWTGKRAVIRLSDHLILAVPPEFQRFWTWSDPPSGSQKSYEDTEFLKSLPLAASVGFDMHLPDFTDYTPENYLKGSDKSRVEVVRISAVPSAEFDRGAAGYYPPNMFERVKDGIDFKSRKVLNGLDCYRGAPILASDQLLCYGARPSSPGEYISLIVDVASAASGAAYPMVYGRYSTKQFGGISIVWRTHADNFVHWKAIDAQISQFLSQWNVSSLSK